MKKIMFIMLLIITSSSFAQWTATSTRTDKLRTGVKNNTTFLTVPADSFYANAVYIVNLQEQIDSLKSVIAYLQQLVAKDYATAGNQTTANSSLSNIETQLTNLNSKDFATATNQTTISNTLTNISTNTENNNLSGSSMVSVNYSSFTQLPNQSIKGIIIYNYSSSNGYVSYDNGANYIILYPNEQYVNDGLRNSNAVYVKGDLTIEYRN